MVFNDFQYLHNKKIARLWVVQSLRCWCMGCQPPTTPIGTGMVGVIKNAEFYSLFWTIVNCYGPWKPMYLIYILAQIFCSLVQCQQNHFQFQQQQRSDTSCSANIQFFWSVVVQYFSGESNIELFKFVDLPFVLISIKYKKKFCTRYSMTK